MSVSSLVFSVCVCVCLEALLSPVFQFYVYDLFPWGSLRREMCDLLAQPVCVCVCVEVSSPQGSGRAGTYCRIKSNYVCSSVMHGCSHASIWDCEFMLVKKILYMQCTHTLTWERETLNLLLSQTTDAPAFGTPQILKNKSAQTHTIRDTGIRALLRSRPVARSWVMRRSPPGSHWTLIRDKDQSLNTAKSWGHPLVPSHHTTHWETLAWLCVVGEGLELLAWQIVKETQKVFDQKHHIWYQICLLKDERHNMRCLFDSVPSLCLIIIDHMTITLKCRLSCFLNVVPLCKGSFCIVSCQPYGLIPLGMTVSCSRCIMSAGADRCHSR